MEAGLRAVAGFDASLRDAGRSWAAGIPGFHPGLFSIGPSGTCSPARLAFEVSRPFRKKREKDGARSVVAGGLVCAVGAAVAGRVFLTKTPMAFNRPIPESHRPEAGQRSKLSSGLASLAEAEKMVQISILLPSSAFVGWLMGAGLDKLLHQTWISMVGILFGGVSGLVYVVRMVTAIKPKHGGPEPGGPKPGAGATVGSTPEPGSPASKP